jgi:hypothetical protein
VVEVFEPAAGVGDGEQSGPHQFSPSWIGVAAAAAMRA